MDAERNSRATRDGVDVNNPYQGPPPLPPWMDTLKRLVYISISAYGLQYFNFFKALLKSPHVRHGWFQVGLACTIAVLTLKAYVEVYQGQLRRTPVDYEHFPQTTHAVMTLIGLATLAYNVALWPHYGWNAPILLLLFFFGLLLQILMILPTSVQNIVALVATTFFLQEYSGYSNLVY